MKRLSLVLALGLGIASAQAQQVVNPQPNAGAYGAYNAVAPTRVTGTGCWLQTDINGQLKITGTITTTPSGTQNVNITQILSAAPSLTNPLWIFPATGASFAVTGTFFQATQPVSQSGTWTVQPGNTANTTPWLVTNTPSAASAAALTPTTTAALASNSVTKASPGNLYSFEVSADSTLSAAAWWIMIFDATSLPANGAVTPKKCYAMASGSTAFSGAWNMPVVFATGITIGVSTTGCFTLTATVHAFISGDAQ